MTFKEVREHLINLQNQNTIKLNEAIEKIARLEREQICMIARQEKTEATVGKMYKLAMVVIPLITVAIPLMTTAIDSIRQERLPNKYERSINEALKPPIHFAIPQENGTHNPIRKP